MPATDLHRLIVRLETADADRTAAHGAHRGSEAARTIGLQILVLNASMSRELDAAFDTLAREPPDALFLAPDGLFDSHPAQFVTLPARAKVPTI
jgi:hypothetical protein